MTSATDHASVVRAVVVDILLFSSTLEDVTDVENLTFPLWMQLQNREINCI